MRTGVMTTSKAPAASSTVPLRPPALLPPCLCSFTWCAQPSRLSDIARPAKRRARKFLLTGSQVAAPAGCTCSHTMSDKVIFGTTITVINLESDQSTKYRIVGEDEADANLGKISYASPLAKQMIGKYEGDTVKVETPGGSTEYEIIKVEYI